MIITKNKKEVKSGCEEMSPFGKDRQDKGLLTDIPYVRTSENIQLFFSLYPRTGDQLQALPYPS